MARPRRHPRWLNHLSRPLLWTAVLAFFVAVVLQPRDRDLFLRAALVFTLALGSWLVLQFLRLIIRGPPSQARVRVGPPVTIDKHHTKKHSLRWDDLVLPEAVLERLQATTTVMKDLQGYQKIWGTLPPHGLLLVGPPGVGKSMSAKVMASQAGVNFFELDSSELKAEGIWGSAEKHLRDFFAQVNANTPAIVFIDEMDSLASARTANPRDGAQQAENNLRNALLLLLEQPTTASAFILTIGGTNRPEVLDEAVLSRLSVTIRFPLPDVAAREKLWQLYTKPYAHRLDMSCRELALESEGYAGRDIANVCREAPLLAHAKQHEVVGINEFKDAMQQLSRDARHRD
jgi:SpoVK/Ycf46/Vps4 family AAA+-type ATPase